MKNRVKIIVKMNFVFDFSLEFKFNAIVLMCFEITSMIQIKIAICIVLSKF